MVTVPREHEARTRIVEAAAKLMHERGFNGTGLQDILDASGVPRGSFYYYFKSKDELGEAVLERHLQEFLERVDARLSGPPGHFLERLQGLFQAAIENFRSSGCRGGCLAGNFALEVSDVNERLRVRDEMLFSHMECLFEKHLLPAVESGEIRSDVNPRNVAQFLVGAWEGALLLMKVKKSVEPLEVCFAELFKYMDSLRSQKAGN
jgi:TetR/AcrR family transcriptional repressor of nem operon